MVSAVPASLPSDKGIIMTNPFAGLAAQVDRGHRVTIIDPRTGKAIRDKAGKSAYVEILSGDSAVAENFDREQARRIKGQDSTDDDDTPLAIAKLAALTSGWHLVDMISLDIIDVPCTRDNAESLYAARETRWIYKQVLPAALDIGNFMKPSTGN
jgi:hypothetical protein